MSSPFPPSVKPPPGTYYIAKPSPGRLSVPALSGLICAVVAPLLGCLCVPTIALSLAAIVLGHVSYWRIGRSHGAQWGRGFSIAALLLGYPLLLFSGLMAIEYFPAMLKEDVEGNRRAEAAAARREALISPRAAQALDAAELLIQDDERGLAHGNSPEAKALALKYATLMKAARDEVFIRNPDDKRTETHGQFVTYCELREGRCAFLVYVPAWSKYTGSAQEYLAQLAWVAAQRLVEETLQTNDPLVVALRHGLEYRQITVGRVADTEKRSAAASPAKEPTKSCCTPSSSRRGRRQEL